MKKPALFLLFLVMSASSYAQSSNVKTLIDQRADELERQVIEWRHWFHENPELSNREFNTAKRIAEILESFGLEVQTGVAHTGVVAVLNGDKPGPVVGLRADIDGLPVVERVDLPYKSVATGTYQGKEVGVMHACGHDTHIAILLGTAKILTEMKSELAGSVKFIFQPAEEGAPAGEEGGAELMVKEGVLENPELDAVFGLHISAATPVGYIGYREEGIMASSNSYSITIKGKQAHGSAPWLGVDPIVTAAQIINNIQTIVSRNMELTNQAAVITVGQIHGGVRSNIIPEEVYLEGTIRTLDSDMQKKLFERLKIVVENTAQSNGAQAILDIHHGYPVTYNDPALTQMMAPTLKAVAGEDKVAYIKAVTGAEDFSFFAQEVPGLYFFLGGMPAGGQPLSHHTPDFYVDDSGMKLGIRTMTNLVIDYFAQAGH